MKLTALLLLAASCAALGSTEEHIKTNFNATAGGTLVVSVDFGSIEVATNSSQEIAIDVWRKITRKNQEKEKQFFSENPVTFVQDKNSVSIRASHREETSGWFGSGKNRNEAKYTIRIPAQFNVQLRTAGGAIAVRDLSGKVNADTSGGELCFARINGPLRGNTSGGSIHLSDCNGTLKVDTSGGSIHVAGGSGAFQGETSGGGIAVANFQGPVAINTSGGGIRLENVAGKIIGSTSGGSIHAVLSSPMDHEVQLSTSGGGVTVRVPASAAFNLEAVTSAGGVTCELPVTVQGTLERDHLKGPVNGGGPALHLETSAGSIRVEKL